MKQKIAALLMVGIGLFAGDVFATEGDSAGQYGVVYGDGLRHLAEGHYEAAVRELFRAYGMRPSAQVMSLIIDAYDAMGNCEAVERQLQFFDRSHKGEEPPKKQRCRVTGELLVECGRQGTVEIYINGTPRGRCGEVWKVPAEEELTVSLADGTVARTVRLEICGREHLTLVSQPRLAEVTRLPGFEGHVERLPAVVGDAAQVPRLSVPAAAYTVFQSEDGIYQVWMRQSQPVASVDESNGAPRVEIICPDDAPDGEVERGCLWLRELRRRSKGTPDNPQRYEVVVPRIP